MYTASDAFFEALWESGVRNVFVNLGSDHPSLLEAMIRGQTERPDEFPKIFTCPNEMVAMSMADGYARLTNQPQCVIVHVDVGTQGLGAAMHNASCGRAPVLVFSGLSPFTADGELRGSRTEYIHWIQDVPDQKQIVAQYCRYTGEVKTGRNVKQLVRRALQFATSAPMGPVYLCGAREPMEEVIEPYQLARGRWNGVGPAALPDDAVDEIAAALAAAADPLVIVGYTGRNHRAVQALVDLADLVKGVRVLDTGISDLSFPATHRASLGCRYGLHPAITTADVILVVDCDVPWIPTRNRPRADARIFHIDVDPLKQQMPVFYIDAEARWRADAFTALTQLAQRIANTPQLQGQVTSAAAEERWAALGRSFEQRQADIAQAEERPADGTLNPNYLVAELRKTLPADSIFAVEAVTNTPAVADHLQVSRPGGYINCGGGGLGWSGGAALGIKLAADAAAGGAKGSFVCQIVGDGTYLFSVPGSVYWIAARYKIPVLTVVLNNKGWNAPRSSLLLVHPDGQASKASNEQLNISFAPTPDYPTIAAAAGGYEVWGGTAFDVGSLDRLLKEAVAAVQAGRSAVLEAQLGGREGKFDASKVTHCAAQDTAGAQSGGQQTQ